MPQETRYYYRMQRIDQPGYNERDLENDPEWAGLRYLKAVGINDIGK